MEKKVNQGVEPHHCRQDASLHPAAVQTSFQSVFPKGGYQSED